MTVPGEGGPILPEPQEPADIPAGSPGCGALLFVLVTGLLGAAYLAWVAAIEGWRIWVVLGLILLIALCAGLAHRLMALTRR